MKIKDLTKVADQYRAYPSSFNGMRENNELKGEGNSLDFGARCSIRYKQGDHKGCPYGYYNDFKPIRF